MLNAVQHEAVGRRSQMRSLSNFPPGGATRSMVTDAGAQGPPLRFAHLHGEAVGLGP